MWQTLALGALLFPALFAAALRSLATLAPAWSRKDRIVLSGRLVSSIQATMATLSGLVVISSCKDVVRDRHWLAQEYVWIVVSYMTYDVYIMYLCYWHKSEEKGEAQRKHSLASIRGFLQRERLMVTHHIFILVILTPVAVRLRGEQGDFFVGCIYTAELSTPFVSLGKILMQLNLQDSLLHKVNGILILATFFLCRILLFPYMYWAYAQHLGTPIYEVPFRIPFHCNVANAVLIAPQLYWFFLICRKAMRLYSSAPTPDRSR
ncbi:TLC domain-containing protein 3A [Heteronotia binoei]|uniref:TLC domain-containing protein 3A n=1 Tax=Heteronotia binoei TaxID=13085 RepID=UPI00292D1B7B|nr:TLC domain-containing protein 3A [Heteronotia binoei]